MSQQCQIGTRRDNSNAKQVQLNIISTAHEILFSALIMDTRQDFNTCTYLVTTLFRSHKIIPPLIYLYLFTVSMNQNKSNI